MPSLQDAPGRAGAAKDQVNLTDEESRIMPTSDGLHYVRFKSERERASMNRKIDRALRIEPVQNVCQRGSRRNG